MVSSLLSSKQYSSCINYKLLNLPDWHNVLLYLYLFFVCIYGYLNLNWFPWCECHKREVMLKCISAEHLWFVIHRIPGRVERLVPVSSPRRCSFSVLFVLMRTPHYPFSTVISKSPLYVFLRFMHTKRLKYDSGLSAPRDCIQHTLIILNNHWLDPTSSCTALTTHLIMQYLLL